MDQCVECHVWYDSKFKYIWQHAQIKDYKINCRNVYRIKISKNAEQY